LVLPGCALSCPGVCRRAQLSPKPLPWHWRPEAVWLSSMPPSPPLQPQPGREQNYKSPAALSHSPAARRHRMGAPGNCSPQPGRLFFGSSALLRKQRKVGAECPAEASSSYRNQLFLMTRSICLANITVLSAPLNVCYFGVTFNVPLALKLDFSLRFRL
jgi:hypothetical protein